MLAAVTFLRRNIKSVVICRNKMISLIFLGSHPSYENTHPQRERCKTTSNDFAMMKALLIS